MSKFVAIIGGGPAGLMAAEVLLNNGIAVKLYDAMPSLGRKFLMAGKSGLNLTHAENFETFVTRYGDQQHHLMPVLKQFGPQQIQQWANQLGIETFVGTSQRVFPKEMKAAPLLRAWLHRLRSKGLQTYTRHQWLGWNKENKIIFNTPHSQKYENPTAVLLALGGASWPKLGSTGSWQSILKQKNIEITALQASNCGLNYPWSDYMQTHHGGDAVKSIELSIHTASGQFRKKGDFVISQYGLEGGLVYTFSAKVREQLALKNKATLYLDLCPDRDMNTLVKRLSKPQGRYSFAKHLQRSTGIKGVKAKLLREFYPNLDTTSPTAVAAAMKQIPIPITSMRPLEEAISTAGGIALEELDENFMLKKLPGVFCAGEMLNWDAPTGGYLFSACFALGSRAGHGISKWLNAD